MSVAQSSITSETRRVKTPRSRKKRARSRRPTLKRCRMDLFEYDEALRQQGFFLIAGIDEAGRGPLAGPVVAAAVILPEGLRIDGVRDSKIVPQRERERLHDRICTAALAYATGVAQWDEIDRINILQATRSAMMRALAGLSAKPDLVVIDAVRLPELTVMQRPVVRGDAVSACVAAASILAKVTRDRLMIRYHEEFPLYGFARHKGYATQEHLDALRKHGPCPIHRLTFDQVRTLPLPFI
ncbi:MAG TPA: ribonuclease HII [Dissulfurispiraceae bacterium]|nr:ribonuclease HII [Dissulfurispiraceae bacterium]